MKVLESMVHLMENLAVRIACLLAVAGAVTGRHLTQGDASCEAVSSIEIVVENGSCSGRGGASCEAVSMSKSVYQEAFEEWYGDNYEANLCDKMRIEAAATAVAEAVASVYTSAYVQIECTEASEAGACGFSQSNGEAWAVATAEAIANALADAGDEEGKGFCLSDVRAVSAVIARATAKSLAEDCISGVGNSYRFSENNKISLQKGIAEAFATATAAACRDGLNNWSQAECDGDSVSTVEGTATPSAPPSPGLPDTGAATGGQVTACRLGVRDKCCAQDHDSLICECAVANGCQSGLYSQLLNFSDDQIRVWEAPDGTTCACS